MGHYFIHQELIGLCCNFVIAVIVTRVCVCVCDWLLWGRGYCPTGAHAIREEVLLGGVNVFD